MIAFATPPRGRNRWFASDLLPLARYSTAHLLRTKGVVLAALSVLATLTLFAARRPDTLPRETREFARNSLPASSQSLLRAQLPVGSALPLVQDRMRKWRIPCVQRPAHDGDSLLICFGDALLWSGVYARMSFRLGFHKDRLAAIVACPTLVAWRSAPPPQALVARLRDSADRVACWSEQSRAIDSPSDSYWASASLMAERPYNVQFIPAVPGIRDTVRPSTDTLVVRW
jgi:hypothetical protein